MCCFESNSCILLLSTALATQHPGIASDRRRLIGIAGASPAAGGVRMIDHVGVLSSFLKSDDPLLRACDALADIDPFPEMRWEDLRMDSGDTNRKNSQTKKMRRYVPGESVRSFFGNALTVRQQGWHWFHATTGVRLRPCNAAERAHLVGMRTWRHGVVLSIQDTSLVFPPPASRSFLQAVLEELDN